MPITGLNPDTEADIARVAETLAMITPRWNVRILLALSGPPQRYSEIAGKVSWLQSGQLHPKLQALCDSGLIVRDEQTPRHVTYGRTDRATALLSVLPLIVNWAEQYLETTDQPLPAIEQIEDSLTLLTRRHAAAILWVLRSREEISARALATVVMPSRDWTNVYPPLRQLVADGLVDTTGNGQPYRLSAAGRGLAPVMRSLSAWSAGRSLEEVGNHPVWGHSDAAPAPQQWVSNHPRSSGAPAAPMPVRTGQPAAAWHNRDLFSHTATARPQALPVGGPRR